VASTRRLFVALVLGDELGARVATAVERALGARRGGLALYSPCDLHLTLVFLGAVSAAGEAQLREWLELNLDGLAAPRLWLTGGGAFPAAGRERILWIGLEDTTPGRLASVQARVSEACVASGFAAEERAWQPHVTVARVRRGGAGARPRIPAAFYELNLAEEWKPRAVSLVESVGGEGDRYRVLGRFPLPAPPRED